MSMLGIVVTVLVSLACALACALGVYTFGPGSTTETKYMLAMLTYLCVRVETT